MRVASAIAPEDFGICDIAAEGRENQELRKSGNGGGGAGGVARPPLKRSAGLKPAIFNPPRPLLRRACELDVQVPENTFTPRERAP